MDGLINHPLLIYWLVLLNRLLVVGFPETFLCVSGKLRLAFAHLVFLGTQVGFPETQDGRVPRLGFRKTKLVFRKTNLGTDNKQITEKLWKIMENHGHNNYNIFWPCCWNRLFHGIAV